MSDPSAPPRRLHVRRLIALALICAATAWSGADRTASSAAAGTSIHGSTRPPASSPTFRVATFNIHSGVGLDRRRNLSRVAALLEGYDFIGLNEVRGPGLSEPDQAEQLGRALELAWLFAPAERQWWHDHFGNAVLARLPVTRWKRLPLTGTRGKGYRNYVRLQVQLGPDSVAVLVTHLDRSTDRADQLQAVLDEFLRLPTPAILMGDLNTTAGDPALHRLCRTSGVVDCLATARQSRPEAIDWIVARGLTCKAAGLQDNDASDHPLAWAELSLPDH